MKEVEDWRRRFARKASRMTVGGSRPPDNPATSWFGRVSLAEPAEMWPVCQGRLMWPLLQIVVRELPFCPASLSDIAVIRVFIDPRFYELNTDAGEGWAVRTSATLEGLDVITEPAHESKIRPFPGRWELVEADYPTHDDLPWDSPSALRDSYYELGFENVGGTKVGGWPSNVQSEIFWAPMNKHPHNPQYAFQIDTEPKAHWMWGDSGVGYFGRGTGVHQDEWAMSWQCC